MWPEREELRRWCRQAAAAGEEKFEQLLLFLEAHAVGILTTVVIHLALVVLFLFLQISSLKRQEEVFYVDLSVLTQTELQTLPEKMELAESEPMAPRSQAARDIPVNTAQAEHRAVESISRMVSDIKTELNVKDMKLEDPEDIENQPEETTAQSTEAGAYEEQQAVTPGSGTIYSGASHVTYRLEGRTHTRMRVPSYKCRGAGTVVVDIVVNQRGYVLAAVFNKALSSTDEACFVSAAREEAERSRFNADSRAPERQSGTITYVFVAQDIE